ncbi:ROK family transcriptional regulator [Actibacterium lipolyticum]|uniref:N-acetylglucosamine repressor n=1 Tax=Actibacterium lipolyticum TaxID=1524263 RepID=A0A238KPU8_9RHOB|nr:ROK family transcriptional regulator [Actibacterium lipolyticum]SMX44815.1 N-acetylglucosamine repressor [Actibacterium lipolyticum]
MVTDQRDAGRRLVFSTIRKAGRIARVDLARETGISPATVTSITAELIREGLIEETGPSQDNDLRRGRPRVDLKVRGAARIVAGMKLSHQTIAVALVDFEGTLVGEACLELDRARFKAAELLPLFRRALEHAVSTAGMTMDALAGIGIGMAGTVDAAHGTVYWSPGLSERNVPLREMLMADLDMPVFIDNDANLVAMAEQYFGHGRGVSDFIVLTIESGVGMGIVVNHEIYRGARGCGAEFGHTKVQLDGALCRCGQRGCLEAYVADYALLREAATTTDFADRATTAQKLQSLVEAAQAGDETAKSIFDRAGRMFAMGLANIVNIFDPELIILSGERMQFDYLYAEDVLDGIRKSIVQIDMAPPEVRIHKWGDLMWAKGAAAYAIEGVAEIALQDIAGNAA